MPVPVYYSPLDSVRGKPRVSEIVRRLSAQDMRQVYDIPKINLMPARVGVKGSKPSIDRRESVVDLNYVTNENSKDIGAIRGKEEE